MNGRVAKILNSFAGLTQESASELKKQWSSLTPEQRAKALRRMQHILQRTPVKVQRIR